MLGGLGASCKKKTPVVPFLFLCAPILQVCGGAEGLCARLGQEARGARVGDRRCRRARGRESISGLEEQDTKCKEILEVRR